jgi:hypothetical protein
VHHAKLTATLRLAIDRRGSWCMEWGVGNGNGLVHRQREFDAFLCVWIHLQEHLHDVPDLAVTVHHDETGRWWVHVEGLKGLRNECETQRDTGFVQDEVYRMRRVSNPRYADCSGRDKIIHGPGVWMVVDNDGLGLVVPVRLNHDIGSRH